MLFSLGFLLTPFKIPQKGIQYLGLVLIHGKYSIYMHLPSKCKYIGKYTSHMDPIRYANKPKATWEINLLRWRSFEAPWLKGTAAFGCFSFFLNAAFGQMSPEQVSATACGQKGWSDKTRKNIEQGSLYNKQPKQYTIL